MEYNVIEKSKKKIINNQTEITIQELLHDDKSGSGEKSGLYCSGRQTVVSIPFNRTISAMINKIIHSYMDNQPMYLEISSNGIEIKDSISGQ